MGSTDDEWRAWGERDPYFAVLTHPSFRRDKLDEEALREFFASGALHVDYLRDTCRRNFGASFSFGRVLDFGCGVGRITAPLARLATSAVGVDVSQGMLDEARRRCDGEGLTNVDLVLSDDGLTHVHGHFDFVHSFIVLQHIDVERGRAFFERLLALTAPGGVVAVQVTYAKLHDSDRFGKPLLPTRRSALRAWLRRIAVRLGVVAPTPDELSPDPRMQMNAYSLDELLFTVQRAGARSLYVDFTDHGGELGVYLFFKQPSARSPTA